jgi:NDP-sugar pyrophosphorylase family protein
VGRLSCVADSVVGEDVDLGSGIITVNHTLKDEIIGLKINEKAIKSGLTKLGAFIGDQTKVGARNTLAPGTIIPAKKNIPHNIS